MPDQRYIRILIYRGTHEIGGNCVELSSGSTRLILDLGMPLVTCDGEPFDSSSIRGKSISQLLQEGVLPNVPGMYSGDSSPPTAILLSHAHADHAGLLNFSDPSIPIYLSQGTSKMLMAGSIFAGQQAPQRERCKTLEPEKPTQIGEFIVTALSVDHSAFDSFAFLIEAGEQRLLYSGDLRLHGRKPWMAKNLLAAVQKSPVDALLMEGTQFSPGRERGITEHELEAKIITHLQDATGLALACFSPMHVDRLVTFYKAARKTGRVFVVDPYAAFVMHLVSGQCKIPAPKKEAGIQVYYNAYFQNSWERRRLQKIYEKFNDNRIKLDEIFAEPGKYLMVFRPSMLQPDFCGRLPAEVCCLYSYWTGYLENSDWTQLRADVESVNGKFIVAHTSGHIFREDIIEFVKAINPRLVIPIHTFQPDEFAKHFSNARLLQDGEEFIVG